MRSSGQISVKLKEVGNIITGGTPSKKFSDSYGDFISFLTPNDFYGVKYNSKTERMLSKNGKERMEKKICNPPSISVSCIGSQMGKVKYNINTLVTNQQINTITNIDTTKYDPDYIYYVLSTMKDYFHSVAGGSTMPIINKTDFGDFNINLPSVNIQKKIGYFLSLMDKKIELNNSIINNLEELAQTLFKRWFVDFEFPDEDGNPYKSNGGKMVESELGLIPEGWEVTTLNSIAPQTKDTFNPSKEESTNVAHFSFPAFDAKKFPEIENSETIKSNKYFIDKWSVMFSRMNPKTPRVWLPNIIEDWPNVSSSEFVVLNTKKYSNKSFIYSLISSKEFNNFLISNQTGSTNSRQRVRADTAISYRVSINWSVMNDFEELIQKMMNKILVLRIENKKLSALRDTLLPKLLSGEIEIPEEMEVTDDVPIS